MASEQCVSGVHIGIKCVWLVSLARNEIMLLASADKLVQNGRGDIEEAKDRGGWGK